METSYLIVFYTLCSVYGVVSQSTVNSCCKNGGICVLGTFCKCPKFYIGRYCQYEINYKNCRNVPHGYWIRSDCNKCRCFNGRVVCIPKYYFGCEDDDEPLDPTKKIDPFGGKTITIYAKDPDVRYPPTSTPQGSIGELYDDDYYYSDISDSATYAQFSFLVSVCLLSINLL
ncbi:uncharacterized protein LOC134236868 [Saccostrea cucullata]|uniref:uncharacterized protein LOC134236868 n=1 Tax=Saccostrea cuccullata TaxID=36930 RepID=UPI002ED186C8